jgi:hypothetical protein
VKASPDRIERLYTHAIEIRECGKAGLWLPIIRHLALRGHPASMTDLASWLYDLAGERRCQVADRLYYRAFKSGHATAAQNCAMERFNRRDLQGFRTWLRRAADLGDTNAARDLKRFATRQGHALARKIGRGRPW